MGSDAALYESTFARERHLYCVEDASPEVLESMEDAANIHDEEC